MLQHREVTIDESFNHDRKRWRFKEQKRLYTAYTGGANVTQCSEFCDRSVGSIEIMLQRMGLINEAGEDVFPRPEFKYHGREYGPRQLQEAAE